VRGEGQRLAIFYADFECPHCASLHFALAQVPNLRVVLRHFPVRARHPRAFQLACAAEAAGLQGAFWAFADSLFGDQGRLDPPHLWARVERLGLDLDRFERDRRSAAVRERVEADLTGGLRAGVAGTPTLFLDGQRYTRPWPEPVLRLLGRR